MLIFLWYFPKGIFLSFIPYRCWRTGLCVILKEYSTVNLWFHPPWRTGTFTFRSYRKKLSQKEPHHTYQQTVFGLWRLRWLSSHCRPQSGSLSLINILEVEACFLVLVFPVFNQWKDISRNRSCSTIFHWHHIIDWWKPLHWASSGGGVGGAFRLDVAWGSLHLLLPTHSVFPPWVKKEFIWKRKHRNRAPQRIAREKKGKLNREHISIFQVVSEHYGVRRVLPERLGVHGTEREWDSEKAVLGYSGASNAFREPARNKLTEQ